MCDFPGYNFQNLQRFLHKSCREGSPPYLGPVRGIKPRIETEPKLLPRWKFSVLLIYEAADFLSVWNFEEDLQERKSLLPRMVIGGHNDDIEDNLFRDREF